MSIMYVREVILYYNVLFSTNTMALEDFKVEVNEQITILKFRKTLTIFVFTV